VSDTGGASRAVAEHLDAVAAMDRTRIAHGYHEHATLRAFGEEAHGREPITRWFLERADFFSGLDLHIERLSVDGGTVRLGWWASLGERAFEGVDEFDVDADGSITAQRVERVASTTRGPCNVRIELEPPIGRIVLDRAAKRNAVSQPMLAVMTDAVREFAAVDAIRAVVIAGDGPDFCAGEDVRGFDFPDHEKCAAFLDGPLGFFTVLEELFKPVVVGVHGHALGFGSEILLAADTVVADPASTFGFAEIDHGAVPSVLVTRGLDTVFRRRVLALALTGARIGVDLAISARLVHVVADDSRAEAERLAAEQSQWSPASVATIKAVLGAGAADDHDTARDFMPPVLMAVAPAL
jgi:enoyl-CoA hydratase/carnithine racemase